MIFTPLRFVAWMLGLAVVAAPLAAIAFFVLAVAGSPGSCETEGRPIDFTPQQAVAFQMKWDQFSAALDAGPGSTVVFSEGEATSRARLWIEEHDVPVSDFMLCFNTDAASASGKVDVPYFPGDVDVKVSGTVELRGEHPVAIIDDVEIGGLPGPLADLVEELVDDLVDEQTELIELEPHDYHVTFGEGEATVTGQQ